MNCGNLFITHIYKHPTQTHILKLRNKYTTNQNKKDDDEEEEEFYMIFKPIENEKPNPSNQPIKTYKYIYARTYTNTHTHAHTHTHIN